MNGKITARQGICTLYLYVLGSSLVTGGSEQAGQDSWIAVGIGLVFTIPLVLLFAKLGEAEPGMDLFDMCEAAFGKIGGNIATLLFSVYSLHLGALVIRDFTEYVQVLSLPETPQPVVAVCIGFLGWYSIRKGIAVTARNAAFIAPLGTIVIFLLLGLTAGFMDLGNLKPFWGHDTKTLLESGFSSFVFPFAESVLFLSVFCDVEKTVPRKKLYLWGILLPGAILIALVAGNTAVLGVSIVQAMYFPSYETVSVVHLGEFLSRFEVLVSGNFMIFGLVKFMVCAYVASRGFAHLTGWQNWLLLTAITSAVAVILSQLLYENTMEMVKFLDVYYVYAPFFEVAIPLAVLVTLSIKKALSRRRQCPAAKDSS